MLLTVALATSITGAMCLVSVAVEPGSKSIEFFEKKIRPVFIEQCIDCHSGDDPESGLRVDTLAGLIRGGMRGPAIVIGKPEQSLLVRTIRHGELVKMPAKKKLPAAQIADIVRWIKQGASWPNEKPPDIKPRVAGNNEPVWTAEQKSFWSLVPPVAAPLPTFKSVDWLQTPIDAFVLAQLEGAKLSPAPRADKRTLIRRATFDLIGLPPTPDEVDAFLDDESAGAFARVIDRLLASTHYGQRWGRHWLDVARYADSNGLDENLAYANAFRYRDYVVRAMNRDLPFDQFVREQLAGDLLSDAPGASLATDRLTATGFLGLGAKMLAEDDPIKMQMDIIDEQIDTVGRTFMGMTMGCARCHDHKFDPISAHDYYAMAGIFKSTRTMENFKVVARWQERPLATPAALREQKLHEQKIQSAKAEVALLIEQNNRRVVSEARRHVGDYLLAVLKKTRTDRLLAAARPRGEQPDIAAKTGVLLIEAENFARGNVLKDTTSYGAGIGVLVNKGQLPNFVEYDFDLPADGVYQLDLRYAAAASRPCKLFINGELVKADVAGNVTGSWNPDGQKWAVEGFFSFREKKNIVRLEQPQFFPHIDKLLISPAADDSLSTAIASLDAAYRPLPQFVTQWAKFLETKPKADDADIFKAWRTLVSASTIDSQSLRETAMRLGERFRQIDDKWQQTRQANSKVERLDDDGEDALRRILHDSKGPFALPENIETRFAEAAQKQLVRLREMVKSLETTLPQLPLAMAVSDQNPTDVRIHIRGSHLSKGASVKRRLPRVMTRGAQPTIGEGQSGRLQLAEWLTDSQHPLTARVMVNRIWLWHFGEGLVRSPDNFGRLGERPTHPELLDWLAVQFVKSGWSMKSMHRMILLSSVWQQSIKVDAPTFERDPENRLLARMNRRRLEAEAIRDSLLAVAGSLEESMGGTLLPTKNRAYVTSTANVDPVVYVSNRRSIYLPVVRSALFDVFQAFDFADPSVLNGKRQSTTVAPQALFMMNSKFVAEQSRRMAERLFAEEPSDDATRVARAWRLAYSRPPSTDEVASSLNYVDTYSRQYRLKFPDRSDVELRSWQSLCRAIMAANEFLFVE
jgi:cytochrome c553